ncbi:MAG: DMT family transporter [Armatimonadetes bacterium]|nr:DMT family transporter [Armatimonadota bacterium]
MSDHTRGILLGLLASVLWSSVFVAARYVTYVRGVDPYYTAALRFGSGALVAALYFAVTGRFSRLLRASAALGSMVLLGAIGIFGMGILVFISASLTTSINSALLLNTNAIFIAVFALFVGERVPRIRFLGLVIGLAGCAMIVLSSAPAQTYPVLNNALGSLAALGGAVCWALYTVLGKRVSRRYGGPEVATGTLIFGSLMLAVVAAVRNPALGLEWPEALATLYLGVFPTALAMLVWYRALELVDASVLGPTQYIAPLGATLLGWWLLGEPLSVTFVGAAVAIIAGVYLATRPERAPDDAQF